MKIPTAPRLALAAALALLVPGCAFVKPTLDFKSARATNIDLEGANLELTFALRNPNPLGFNLDSIRYDLEVEGRPVVSGKPPNGLAVKPQGVSDLVFPTRVRFQDIAPVLTTFLTKDRARYRASGAVGIRTPIGPIELPLSYQGSFPVPKLPDVTFQPPRIQSLTIQGARIVFPIQIANKNEFPLPLGGLSANLAIAGASVGTVQAVTPPSLAASQAHVLEIPLDVNFWQVGWAVAQAIQSRSANVRLSGALRSGAASLPIEMSENLTFR